MHVNIKSMPEKKQTIFMQCTRALYSPVTLDRIKPHNPIIMCFYAALTEVFLALYSPETIPRIKPHNSIIMCSYTALTDVSFLFHTPYFWLVAFGAVLQSWEVLWYFYESQISDSCRNMQNFFGQQLNLANFGFSTSDKKNASDSYLEMLIFTG